MADTLVFILAGSLVGLGFARLTRFRGGRPAPAAPPSPPEPQDD